MFFEAEEANSVAIPSYSAGRTQEQAMENQGPILQVARRGSAWENRGQGSEINF